MWTTFKKTFVYFSICCLAGCAGWGRRCSSWEAGNFGANWVIVQLDAYGKVIRCWQLEGVSVANEENSDGIYWKNEAGNLVHLSGFYNRVQVMNDRWADAFATMGIDGEKCPSNAEKK